MSEILLTLQNIIGRITKNVSNQIEPAEKFKIRNDPPFGWKIWERNRKEILAMAESRFCPFCESKGLHPT